MRISGTEPSSVILSQKSISKVELCILKFACRSYKYIQLQIYVYHKLKFMLRIYTKNK